MKRIDPIYIIIGGMLTIFAICLGIAAIYDEPIFVSLVIPIVCTIATLTPESWWDRSEFNKIPLKLKSDK